MILYFIPGALIKKQRYWPKFVDGEAIDAYMAPKEVGSLDSIVGKLEDQFYSIHCMKEPYYVMKTMTMYRSLAKDQAAPAVHKFLVGTVRAVLNFFYSIYFANHFCYRHEVDDHNNLRHKSPAIEET